MPRIPTYQRQVSLPGQAPNVMGSVHDAGALANTIGNVTEEFTNVIEQQQELIRRRDNANRLLIVGAAYDDEQRAFESTELQRQGQDSYDNVTRGSKFREESVKKYTQDITDPDLKQAVTQHIFSRSGGMLNSLSVYQSKQRDEVTKTALENMTQGVLKDAYAGADLEDSLNRARMAVKTQQAAGAYGTDGAVEILMKAEKNIAEAHLDGLINRDPVAAIAAIKTGKYSQYLDQKSIEAFDNKANQIQKAMVADAEHAANEAKRLEKERKEVERQEVNKNLVDMEASGKLTWRKVQEYKAVLGENEYKEWKDRITRRNEKMAREASGGGSGGGGGGSSKREMGARIYRDVVANSESMTEKDILDRAADAGLSYSATKELIAEKRRRDKGEVDPAAEVGEKIVIKNLQRDYKNGLFGDVDSREAQRELAKHTEAFVRWRKNHPKEDPSEYYEKLTEPSRDKWFTALIDREPSVDELKKRRERMAGQGNQPKPAQRQTPAINQWLTAAKKANPKASDSELRAYYAKKYGAR